MKKFKTMEVKNAVVKILGELEKFDYDKCGDVNFKELGVTSIAFLNIVIKTCKALGIDFMTLKSINISSKNTINEYIEAFDSFLVTK